MVRLAISWLLGLLGAILGGLAGYFAFMYAKDQGFYAPVLAGGLVGVGCGLLSRHHSMLRGILCGIAGVLLGYYCDYRITILPRYETFADTWSLFPSMGPWTNIMVILGGLVSYWFGQTHYFTPRYRPKSASPEWQGEEARP